MADGLFTLLVLAIAVFAGANASIVGFGIGSMLTPLLAVRLGTATAVAAVMVPHAVATAMRCWRLRRDIDRGVLLRFGLLSAAGSLAGAVLYTQLSPPMLTRVLGALLVLTAVAQLSGLASRWKPHGPVVALLGLGSRFFGGIAGNQGGMRAAALATFSLRPVAFVATSTAAGLLVDAARAPVYLWTAGSALRPIAPLIAVATAGVVVGTLLGERILLGLTPQRFARSVAVAIGLLGVWLLLSQSR